MVVFSFELVTDAEKVAALRAALADLEARLKPVAGFQGCRLLTYVERPFAFRLEELWDSADAHDRATEALPREVLERIQANVTEPAAPVRLEAA